MSVETGGTDARAGVSTISVAYVDDYEELCELTAEGLEDANDRLDVTTITDPTEVTDRLDEFDCIISDYEMPEIDGLELLRQVRVLDDDLPFILFTGKGSEDVASDAISLDVTDYLTKRGGPERFTRLAHRVESVVDAQRATDQVENTREQAEEAIERERARLRALIQHSPAVTTVLDESGTVEFVSPSVEDVTGYTPRDLRGEYAFEYVHDQDRERVERAFERSVRTGEEFTVEYRFRHRDGGWRHLESRAVNRLDDAAVGGVIVNSRDVTEQTRTEEQLRRERDLTDSILEVTPTPLVVMDREGSVRRVNDRTTEVFDVDRSFLVGSSPDDPEVSFRDADGDPVESGEYIWEVVTYVGSAIRDVECEVTLPSGDYRMTVGASPLPEPNDDLAVVSIEDVEPQ